MIFFRLPGALGIFLRSKFYPMILAKVGKGIIFGTNIVFRHPRRIFLGNNVIIDHNVLLDAKGTENKGVILSDEVFIGRNSIINFKGGSIELGARVNIGFNCEVFSSNKVIIGQDTLIAALFIHYRGGEL